MILALASVSLALTCAALVILAIWLFMSVDDHEQRIAMVLAAVIALAVAAMFGGGAVNELYQQTQRAER